MRDRGRLCVFKALTKKALATKIYDIQQANLAAIENTLARTDAALSMIEYVAAITDTVSVHLEKRQSAIQEGRIDLDHCSLPFFLRREKCTRMKGWRRREGRQEAFGEEVGWWGGGCGRSGIKVKVGQLNLPRAKSYPLVRRKHEPTRQINWPYDGYDKSITIIIIIMIIVYGASFSGQVSSRSTIRKIKKSKIKNQKLRLRHVHMVTVA